MGPQWHWWPEKVAEDWGKWDPVVFLEKSRLVKYYSIWLECRILGVYPIMAWHLTLGVNSFWSVYILNHFIYRFFSNISTFTSHPFKRCLVMHLFFTNQPVLGLTVEFSLIPWVAVGFSSKWAPQPWRKETAAACDAKWPSSWSSSQIISGFLVKIFTAPEIWVWIFVWALETRWCSDCLFVFCELF